MRQLKLTKVVLYATAGALGGSMFVGVDPKTVYGAFAPVYFGLAICAIREDHDGPDKPSSSAEC